VQVARRRRREPDSHTALCFISHFGHASGASRAPISNFQFSETPILRPMWLSSGPKRAAPTRDTPVVLPAVYGNRYPHPTASFATGTPVRLLSQISIIHNHRYFVLCTEVGPCPAARLSPRVSTGGSFHLEAQSASPWLHGATEPSARGTEN
jgi:hypothetical protein